MATSQTTEMQVEGEVSVEEAVKEMLEIEVEEDEGDPFEGMNNAQVAEIYHKMKPEDQHLFRQFKRFHKIHYETHGHDAPSHQLARGIIRKMFSGLPTRDAEMIAKARAELLAAERLKELCKQLGIVHSDRTPDVPTSTRGARVPTTSSTPKISIEAGEGETRSPVTAICRDKYCTRNRCQNRYKTPP